MDVPLCCKFRKWPFEQNQYTQTYRFFGMIYRASYNHVKRYVAALLMSYFLFATLKKNKYFVPFCSMVAPCSGRYRHRWLVLKETCLFFLAPNTGQVRTVMLMDAGFQVSHGYRLIGARNGLLISNLSRWVVFVAACRCFRS